MGKRVSIRGGKVMGRARHVCLWESERAEETERETVCSACLKIARRAERDGRRRLSVGG